jgi:hypothetical protein
MKSLPIVLSTICLTLAPLAPPALAQEDASQADLSAQDFYKQCKNAKSDNPDQLKLCYLDSFVALRKTGDTSGKCAPGLIGLLSQPHTHLTRLKATMKDNKPIDDETLSAYQKRILGAAYPCPQQ